MAGADLGFLKGGLFVHWCWKQGGHGGTCPPDFLKRGHRGAPCCEEMYLDLSIIVMIMPCCMGQMVRTTSQEEWARVVPP